MNPDSNIDGTADTITTNLGDGRVSARTGGGC